MATRNVAMYQSYMRLPQALRPHIRRLAQQDLRSEAAEIAVLLVEAVQARLGDDVIKLADLVSPDEDEK